ncbi:MAG: BrnT family toxin, partial [Alphaproteobacteria bacterium]
MDFDWDETKRLSNLEERGVDFKDAALIFEGPVIAKEDTRKDYGEQR